MRTILCVRVTVNAKVDDGGANMKKRTCNEGGIRGHVADGRSQWRMPTDVHGAMANAYAWHEGNRHAQQ